MYNKKVKLRALFLFLSIATLILTIFLVLKALEENVVYFLSPTEIKNLNETTTEKIRLGGMVKDQSIKINSDKIKKAKNIEVLTISNLLAEAIKRISNSTSVSDLFK